MSMFTLVDAFKYIGVTTNSWQWPIEKSNPDRPSMLHGNNEAYVDLSLTSMYRCLIPS